MKIIKQTDSLTESNLFVVVEENFNKAIVIDIGNFEKTKKIIVENNVEIEKLILTHEHYDHIAGLNELRNDYSFEVIASLKCSNGLQDSNINKSKNFGVYLYFLGKEYRDKVKEYISEKADIVFEKEYYFNWYNHDIYIYQTPGHSQGSSCIIIDNKYLFSGDSLIYKSNTITRTRGGSDKDFREITLPFFKKLDKNIKVYPGHGEEFTLGEKLKNI